MFNETLSRLDAAFEQLRRFTADASHELRTPLTGMRSVGEVALPQSRTPPGERDVSGSLLEDVDRLTRLVETLVLLTRAEAARSPLARAPVELGPLVADITDRLRVLAQEKDQSLGLDVPARVVTTGDATILPLAVTNLRHNAITYTPPTGAIMNGARLSTPSRATATASASRGGSA